MSAMGRADDRTVSGSLSSNFRTLDPIARPLCQDDGQPFPNPVREGLPTIRKFARSVNTSAFSGTDPDNLLLRCRDRVTALALRTT